MPPLMRILNRALPDNPRTRRVQAALDERVDRLKVHWDVDRGLIGSRGRALPHESTPGYWSLSETEQARITPPDIRAIYRRNTGREHTAQLCIAAFCWRSSLSRHRGDTELLRFFENGLRYHAGLINEQGLLQSYGLNGEGWAHGWDIEGLIYGLVFCGDQLDPDLLEQVIDRFHLSADRLANLEPTPTIIGSYGNQRLVYALGLNLYGQLLDRADLLEKSDAVFDDALPKVLDVSGQVVEQFGPCMHYSHTAFIYGWLNLTVRGNTHERDRVIRCLDWFRTRHTESLYPIAGPSTRQYNETLPEAIADLLPIAESVADDRPDLRQFVDRAMFRRHHPDAPLPAVMYPGDVEPIHFQHGASTLMWTLLVSPADAEPAGTTRPHRRRMATVTYDSLHLLKRAPLRYLTVRRDYQTQFTYTDFLPFSGIQTWAMEDEPPIIHPTPLAPSTTQGDRLDTAKHGVSHNWGLYGAGAVGIDGYSREPAAENELWSLVARYDWLWRLVFFTRRSVVTLEFGDGGPRRTCWTLNRVEPAEPVLDTHMVGFVGRKGCLHTTLNEAPEVRTLDDDHKWARGVRQLVYACGDKPVAFALSDSSFRFESDPVKDLRVLRFRDSGGVYEAGLDGRFFEKPNPGNFGVDTFQLAKGTVVRWVKPM